MKINMYLFDECDYVASPLDYEETVEWYKKLTGAGDCWEFVDKKTNGFWEEITMEEAKGKVITGDKVFGNLGYFHGVLCVYKSFNDAIKKLGEMKEPEIIASTEY